MSKYTVSHDDLFQRAIDVINNANESLERCKKDASLLRSEIVMRDHLLQNALSTRAFLSVQQNELNVLIQQKLKTLGSDQPVY